MSWVGAGVPGAVVVVVVVVVVGVGRVCNPSGGAVVVGVGGGPLDDPVVLLLAFSCCDRLQSDQSLHDCTTIRP